MKPFASTGDCCRAVRPDYPALRASRVRARLLSVALRCGVFLGNLSGAHSLLAVPALVTSQNSPVSFTQGQPITPISFTVTELMTVGSWRIGGTLPPGLKLNAREKPSQELTTPGVLDATEPPMVDDYGYAYGPPTNATTTPVLTGTPTQSGSFTFTLQAFQNGATGGPTTPVFNFTVNVAAASGGNVAPSFTAQPAAQTLAAGTTLVLTAAVSGTPTPTLQWQKNGVPIPGATSGTLTIPNAQAADAGAYSVLATNAAGNVASAVASVAINPVPPNGPVVARHPAAQVAATGSTVVFSAEVTGATSYQWQKDGAPIAGATGAALVLRAVIDAAGSYAVRATNGSGSVTTNAGVLTLSADPNFGHLVNLSIRASIRASDPVFTLGTTIGGGAPGSAKPLLVRAVGPTLAEFGLTTALADARLEVFSGSAIVASNDNWDGVAALANVFTQVGAFPFASATSKDSAVFNPNLAPGSYTVQIGGVAGAFGEVLAELYDASSAFGSGTPRLVNVSVRKQIEANGSLTAGFVVGGVTARTVLVRAIGPGLGVFGLTGFMADPQLALFSGATKLAENDNWGGDPQLTAAGGGVGAFAISNASSRDAMLLMTLAPGSYTVQVSGVGGTAGETLVEIYEVP